MLIDIERKKEDTLDLIKSMLANNEELIMSAVTISEVLAGVYYIGKRESLLDARARKSVV